MLVASVPLPASDLPRERLIRHGAAALSDAELLAILLRTGVAGCDVMTLSRTLLRQFGGLRGLFAAPREELAAIRGLGEAKVCLLQAILELARREIAETLSRGDVLARPADVRRYCATALAHREVECCLALFLDSRNRLIEAVTLSQGTLGQTAVYPRELARAALRLHAAAVILCHNHPSGHPEPSQADIVLTQHAARALQLIDVRLYDHLIVAGRDVVSLAERGLMPGLA